jgi:hypothetical protein
MKRKVITAPNPLPGPEAVPKLEYAIARRIPCTHLPSISSFNQKAKREREHFSRVWQGSRQIECSKESGPSRDQKVPMFLCRVVLWDARLEDKCMHALHETRSLQGRREQNHARRGKQTCTRRAAHLLL